MTLRNQNFTMYAGNNKTIVVTITKEDGSAIDLTGYTSVWAIRQKESSTKNDAVITNVTGQGNQLTITLVPEDTQNLAGTYFHECQITDMFGYVSTVFTGMVIIHRSVIDNSSSGGGSVFNPPPAVIDGGVF